MNKTFGHSPFGSRLVTIESSPNYKNGQFQNKEPTEVNPGKVSIFKILREIYNRPKTVKPARPLPFQKTDWNSLHADSPLIVWFGHSSYLIHSKGFTILVDPVFSGNASPFSFFAKAFADYYKAEDMPPIDLLLLTHDHYDHLDYKTMLTIGPAAKQIVAPLGVGAHLERWGIDTARLTELDWGQEHSIKPEIRLIATPARHFSGRSFKRNRALWTSYVLSLHGYQLFLGGDSGYDEQFKIIGKTFGPFDTALLECGQYGKYWPLIHMFPEQTVQAAKDLHAKILFPVHWAKFVLSTHPWNEPIQRLTAAAHNEGQAVVSPLIGQPYTIGEPWQQQEWWLIS